MKTSYNRLVNVSLRSTTLGMRFLFVFFLAKFLDPAMVGYYGLFAATIGYAIYFVGLDFYTYTTREILRAPAAERGQFLKAQATVSGGLYLVVLPVAIAILNRAGWPDFMIWWFVPILVLEHYNQEIMRLLIGLSEQIAASFVLFLRQGSWAIAIVALMAWEPESRRLDVVLALWAAGGALAAAMGTWKIRRLKMGGWRLPLDWRWVWKGLTVSLGFLVATLALRAIQTFDRYWIEALGGVEMVGAYVLFMGVAASMMVFLDAGVFAFTYPDLIRHNQRSEPGLAEALIRRALLQTIAIVAAFAATSSLMLPFLLDWIGKPVYQNEIGLFPWILSAMALNALGMIPHFALYARGHDKPIIIGHIVALVAFVMATWALSKTFAAFAVPIGLNLAFFLILVWKTSAYLFLTSPPKGPREVSSSS